MNLITVFRKEWKYFEIALEKYENWYSWGIVIIKHKHFEDNKKYHKHIIFDFGKYYLELTFGNSHKEENEESIL